MFLQHGFLPSKGSSLPHCSGECLAFLQAVHESNLGTCTKLCPSVVSDIKTFLFDRLFCLFSVSDPKSD